MAATTKVATLDPLAGDRSSDSRVSPYNGLGQIPDVESEMSYEQPKVDDEMNDERPEAEKNFGLFFPTMQGGGPGFPVPEPLIVGPGKPGPEDEWHVPAGPVETEEDVVLESAHGAVTGAKNGDRDER